jgi:hypothetical protein
MAKEDRILKVLVCDDDSEDRKIIRHYLSLISDREIVIVEADNKFLENQGYNGFRKS